MKLIIQRIGCSLLLAAVVLGAFAGAVAGIFEGGGTAGADAPSFSPIAAVKPDGGTADAELPSDLSNPDVDVSFDTDFEGDSDPFKVVFSNPTLGGSVPKPDDDRYVMSGSTGNGNTGSTVTDNPAGGTESGGTGVGGEGSGEGGSSPSVGTVTTPPMVSNSGLAQTIKSHTYTSGLDVFQSSRGDIPADTSALMNAVKQGYNTCSFIAVRISDGATIAYNANALYRCASSYKALASLYTYKQAAAGVYNLNTTIKYTAADYYPGSGIIKSSAIGTVYTLKTVADYSINYSDNTAYTMLQRYINKSDLIAYAKSLGCPNYEKFKSNWPDVSAIDEALWWAEIYNFASTNSYGKQLYDVFLSATNPIIKKSLGGEYPVAHKSGSISFYFHDAGIVHSEDPYLLVVLTHNPYNYTSKNESYFYPLVREIDKLINP